LVTALLFGTALAVVSARPARSRPPLMRVVVNGVPRRVPGPVSTVAAVLRAARQHPRGARLYSARSHKLLDGDAGPPTILVNGLAAGLETRVRAGASVVAVDGPDLTESVVDKQVPVPAAGLPDVENTIWYPGKAGLQQTTVGAVSGEVVTARRLTEPLPPRRETAGVVALTFDDGPDPRWTPQVLQLLHDEGVKATFCVVGHWAERFPDLVKAERDQGHVVCDHTMHHVEHLDHKPHAQVEQEIGDGFRTLTNLLGTPPPLYRAPGGSIGPDVIAVAHEYGMRVIGWAIDPHDYERPPEPVLVDRVMSRIRPGSIILMHDGGGDRANTVAAARVIIDRLKAMGYGFATPLSPP
jgi:peptidoglycan/xylan/chitin deacetylase (PgdA/CDA1 family)